MFKEGTIKTRVALAAVRSSDGCKVLDFTESVDFLAGRQNVLAWLNTSPPENGVWIFEGSCERPVSGDGSRQVEGRWRHPTERERAKLDMREPLWPTVIVAVYAAGFPRD